MNSQLSQKQLLNNPSFPQWSEWVPQISSFHMFVGLWVHSTGSYHSPLIPVHCTGSKAFLSDRTISTPCSLKVLCDSWLFASMKNTKSAWRNQEELSIAFSIWVVFFSCFYFQFRMTLAFSVIHQLRWQNTIRKRHKNRLLPDPASINLTWQKP